MKIVMLDSFHVNFDGLGMELPGHEQVWYPSSGPAQVVERIGDAQGVIVNRVRITAEVMDACPNLRYIGALSTGYNMIDVAAAKARSITVCNVPGYSTNAVAQRTFGLLLEIVDRVGVWSNMVRDGKWATGHGREIVEVSSFELAGRTFGIFGAGEIGRRVACIAEAFGMEALAYRRNPPARSAGLQYVGLDELLARSDILSIHAPLTKETQGFFGASILSRMKDGTVLLNTARGALLDEAAVADALDSGKLAAFGADVLASEPPEPGNRLVAHPKSVITPHTAWLPQQTRRRLLDVVAANILAFAAGNPQNVVSN